MIQQQQKIIQVTSGRGPVECCRVVAKVLEIILAQARKSKLEADVIQQSDAPQNGTLLSATILISGKDAELFADQWKGTVRWIAQSPYRKFHKRKNWFVGVNTFDVVKLLKWNENEIAFQTQRASGAGGQHVNKTESSVRAIHLPTKLTVTCAEQRSQHVNKKIAIEKLKEKVMIWKIEQAANNIKEQWFQHTMLERGNPVKTFEETLL